MGYQALLFCPDEKTARTVTQVLSELEFSVEACSEPFAAVKKLMSQHFDAVVVDCDNEQNATLLFKSARNSTSNQASLAVAVVEGQAGVAKAFRIGANLVLTKPINIEQAKGTLRVARGLLRKSEPAKAGSVGLPASAAPEVKASIYAVTPGSFGRGAASAPAPAREREDHRAAEASPERSTETNASSKGPEAVRGESSSLVGSAPSFTYGGANAPAQSSGAGKKILVAVAAVVIVGVAAYATWAHFQRRATEPDPAPTETTPAIVVTPRATQPSAAKPSAASAVPKTSASLPNSPPAAPNEKRHASDADTVLKDSDVPSAASSTKSSNSASPAPSETSDSDEAPLVVKGGKAPAVHAK